MNLDAEVPNPEDLARLKHPDYHVRRHSKKSKNRAKNRVARKSRRNKR